MTSNRRKEEGEAEIIRTLPRYNLQFVQIRLIIEDGAILSSYSYQFHLRHLVPLPQGLNFQPPNNFLHCAPSTSQMQETQTGQEQEDQDLIHSIKILKTDNKPSSQIESRIWNFEIVPLSRSGLGCDVSV